SARIGSDREAGDLFVNAELEARVLADIPFQVLIGNLPLRIEQRLPLPNQLLIKVRSVDHAAIFLRSQQLIERGLRLVVYGGARWKRARSPYEVRNRDLHEAQQIGVNLV